MANTSRLWTRYIDCFFDSSSSIEEQDSNLDSVASLLKDDRITMESVVKEMELYLTTTDDMLRSTGMLFLGKLLERLEQKSLNRSTFCSLIAFFTERLADWKALRGALLGSLALVKRKGDAGTAIGSEARALLVVYFQNIQVQSLGQYDRKLCFQLLKSILDLHQEDCAALGDDLTYGICASVDGEKDPECLLLVFSIVESLAHIFPDPSGPLSRFSGELFEILGCYFPIHYTHPQGDGSKVRREDMADALMMAMSSTHLFEPFSIPLLLEKLSSSLPLAKIDSLRYLRCCIQKYNRERMKKHTEAIWNALKHEITTTVETVDYSLVVAESFSFQDKYIAMEALGLLSDVVKLNSDLFSDIIILDEDIIKVTHTLRGLKSFSDIPHEIRKKLYAASSIISCSIRASEDLCGRLLETLFVIFMDDLRTTNRESGVGLCRFINVGVLFLCKEMLDSCREVVVNSLVVHESWNIVVHKFYEDLIDAFSSTLILKSEEVINDMDFIVGVSGLQILATFPKDFLNISMDLYEQILTEITSVIIMGINKPVCWKSAVGALVKIGIFSERTGECEKALTYKKIVINQMISYISSYDSAIDISKKLEVLFEFGTNGMQFFSTFIQSLEETILSCLSEIYVLGNLLEIDFTAQILDIYSNRLIPWLQKNGGSEVIPRQFTINIWRVVESNESFPLSAGGKELLDSAMMALKVAISICSQETQTEAVEKAYTFVSSNISPLFKKSIPILSASSTESIVYCKNSDVLTHRDTWLLSWFASVIIPLYTQTRIHNLRATIGMLTSALRLGHVQAAQALGSIINKLPLVNGDDMPFSEVLDSILDTRFWNFQIGCSDSGREMGYSVVNHMVMGITWIAKGLLLRGHEKVKDLAMILLRWLMLGDGGEGDGGNGSIFEKVGKNSAEAFHTIVKYSDGCLNEKFHAIIRPLYKQKFFTNVTPIFISSVMTVRSPVTRLMIYRAFGYVISDVPIPALLSDAKKIVPVMLDCISILTENVVDRDLVYGLLLLLSGVLTDESGKEVVMDNAHIITSCLTGLITYPHMMVVRETTIQCLIALSSLPHIRVYPMRIQVLEALSKVVDDPKKDVRREAIKCRHIWKSIVS